MAEKQRDVVRKQWADMLDAGRIPIMELDTKYGTCTIAFFTSAYGMGFNWSLDDSDDFDTGVVTPYFDGCLTKRGDAYYLSWAQIDRDGSSLDQVLQFIHDNVMDGVLAPYGLLPADGE